MYDGKYFAGCDEKPGTFELFQGRKYKVCTVECGINRRYGEREVKTVISRRTLKKLVPEGVEGRVAYKGTVEDTVYQLIGGLAQEWDTVEL